ncbi:hypothetical protein BE221DRAFT_190667 [Ostreococcus tauri]|uniref:Tetratricopeptide repeat n=1 Tax=Ostreococcus tauri TaxID=70448 RepID=A0A1Y5IDL8_OSTTA|nr:hypothetical protein BE221DRAFT_190667 [Ostreococcus tauri]
MTSIDRVSDARPSREKSTSTSASANAMEWMKRAESIIVDRAVARSRADVANVACGSVVFGMAKPGEDGAEGSARNETRTTEDADVPEMMETGGTDAGRARSGSESESSDAETDAETADEEFRVGVLALRNGDVEEALRRFTRAAAALPRGETAAREKLSNTIAQTRALLEQEEWEDDEEEDELDENVTSEEFSREQDGDERAENAPHDFAIEGCSDDDEFHDASDVGGAPSDGGWSETDASLAEDAYRTAVWLWKSAAEEDRPADVAMIVDLLERARQFCPPSRTDAIDRIDALLERVRD